MDLNTIFQLHIGDGTVVNEGDKIAITFKTEEILHGIYQYSDLTSLVIERNNEEIDFDFDEIEDIDILARAN